MTTLEIDFMPLDGFGGGRMPYIHDVPIDYKCDGVTGHLTFDGYYYVEDHAPPYPEDDALQPWERPQRRDICLPQTLKLHVKLRETEPNRIERNDVEMWSRYHYNIIEEHAWVVEIYKRVIHECTDKYSNIDDSDGEEMNVCFFPTNSQTIYFRVVDNLVVSSK